MKTAETRDPIADDPLRDPGQSLREDIDTRIDQRIIEPAIVAGIVFLIAVLEWYRWYTNMPPSPKLMTGVAVIVVGIAIVRVRKALRDIRPLQRGLRGERAMGQFLQDELLPKGYRVLHDICQNGSNIDHVAIGPAGVFAIDTKTLAKPARGNREIKFDGNNVTVDGLAPDRDPIAQGRACAAALKKILREYSGKEVTIQPVVLYPGHWVIEARADVWVLNPKRFLGWLKTELDKCRRADKSLSAETITALAEALARYVRDQRPCG